MNNFECPICYKKFDDPIECLQCHNNFCKNHLPQFNNKCPMCNTCPFRYMENTWLRRIVMNINFYKCILCGFEGDVDSFWSHLIESHKKDIILKFKTNDDNNNNPHENNNNKEKDKCPTLNKNTDSVNNTNIQQNEEVIPHQQEPVQYIQNPNIINFIPYDGDYGNNPNQNPQNQNFSPKHTFYNEANNFNGSSNDRIVQYCGSINKIIKCNCCPDHICKKGNCMCVFCMKENFNKLKLNKDQLINKVGKIAKLNKGSYYCNCEYETIIRNVVGKIFRRKSECCYPNLPCDNCKNLEKFKDIYLKYL